MTHHSEQFGFVAIIGRPNVGKSTLINRFLGRKISITAKKPQTTRHRILGVKTVGPVQLAYVDTPGLHAKAQYLNRIAKAVLQEVNVILWVVDARAWKSEDDWILKQLQNITLPVVLAINKIDCLTDRKQLLPFLEAASLRFDYRSLVPISAKYNEQVPELEKELIACLPQATHPFSPNQWTDRTDQFMASELLREKLMRMLGQELPYAVTVTIDAFEENDQMIRVAASIIVKKASQKAIIIGKQGSHLKKIASAARAEMEQYFEKKVFLSSWVKVVSSGAPGRKAF